MAMVTIASLPSLVSCKPLKREALEWRRSELSGTSLVSAAQPVTQVFRRLGALIVQPLASRVCELTGKKYNNARKVSYSHIRTRKKQQPNLQYKRLWWEAGKRFVRLRICTQALKTIDKKGLEVMAKEAGIDLRKR